ncbi:phage head-tail connector protein [Clostridiales Family XIII bacterium ASD5510]|uniref:Phage head-tail connector protein n=1 Tax=Hominibacterium faecale TaxID=2839743 RepID=A0A9J6QVW6_9FIRM|nr:phage head-tail connector protein [Hominibacterium faecale]MCU7379715.1 phage head-tail connector protein [Hominibacterium faecale]
MDYLKSVKDALMITGDFHDATLNIYINEVVAYLKDAGVNESTITVGIVCRGVADLWAGGSGAFSAYFRERAIQLALKGGDQHV